MPQVKFTSHLYKFFPGLGTMEVEGRTVAEIVAALDKQYPGLAAYIVDEHGTLRKHVNIFIGENLVQDRQALKDTVTAADRVYIFQALSGG